MDLTVNIKCKVCGSEESKSIEEFRLHGINHCIPSVARYFGVTEFDNLHQLLLLDKHNQKQQQKQRQHKDRGIHQLQKEKVLQHDDDDDGMDRLDEEMRYFLQQQQQEQQLEFEEEKVEEEENQKVKKRKRYYQHCNNNDEVKISSINHTHPTTILNTIMFESKPKSLVGRNKYIRITIFKHVKELNKAENIRSICQISDLHALIKKKRRSGKILTWEDIKEYLPPRHLVPFQTRLVIINEYCKMKSSTVETLQLLLEWSPDYDPREQGCYYRVDVGRELVNQGKTKLLKFLFDRYPGLEEVLHEREYDEMGSQFDQELIEYYIQQQRDEEMDHQLSYYPQQQQIQLEEEIRIFKQQFEERQREEEEEEKGDKNQQKEENQKNILKKKKIDHQHCNNNNNDDDKISSITINHPTTQTTPTTLTTIESKLKSLVGNNMVTRVLIFKHVKELNSKEKLRSKSLIADLLELLLQQRFRLIPKDSLTWDVIKEYLPPPRHIPFQTRLDIVDKCCTLENATVETLQHLLEWSPDYDPRKQKDFKHQHLLYDLACLGNTKLLKFIVDRYPGLEKTLGVSACANKQSAIDFASEQGDLEMVELLLTLKDEPTHAIELAQSNGHIEIVQLLELYQTIDRYCSSD
ncbi:hypothetical protein DFA_04149 [Cavenderia fasciculata]|uniref:Ankyrin repeat-containing protein n=1 Tax=Cavenderia fasciculata TaxID=261658 RepID=F4Q1F3_CACFS|nr:uncharacterized protein DFA_04149 [Cavenderia fasciculata]EGG18654.1 hypothetical protein DFA_04149 [Cavenderia fasciculata]|eukprot:XP_004366558.1 hypothetical protein DFA_04149 [Cavenderia fasciculata]